MSASSVFEATKWYGLASDNQAPEASGVYVVRSVADGKPRTIQCPGDPDVEGILYIGSTPSGGTLESRIGALLGGRGNPKLFGHHDPFSSRYYRFREELERQFGEYDSLEVAWRVTDNPAPEERELCLKYYRRHLCLPPLNWRFAGSKC